MKIFILNISGYMYIFRHELFPKQNKINTNIALYINIPHILIVVFYKYFRHRRHIDIMSKYSIEIKNNNNLWNSISIVIMFYTHYILYFYSC